MNIEPLSGLNVISFGDSLSAAKELFGEPDVLENINGEDGVSSEVWIYTELGLELYFDPNDDFKLWGMNITSREISLEGHFPVGLSEQDLNSRYYNLKTTVQDGKYKELEYPYKEIEFWLKEDSVYLVRVWSKTVE